MRPNARRSPVSLLGSSSPGDSEPPETNHPSAGQLEATAFGWLAEPEAQAIRSHAASCAVCAASLRAEERVRDRLGLLRQGEPRMDVAGHVLARLDHLVRPRAWRRPSRGALVVLSLVAAGVLVASRSELRRTARRLGALIALST